MNLTAEQQAAIAAKVNSMTLPKGMGDEHSACSIAAINLALSGRLTDEVPDCMSGVVGWWIMTIQDFMPDDTRNSQVWKSLLPIAAGTGRDHEQEREALILEWMWGTVLPYVQPIADAGGYGKEWRAMCEERTGDVAWVAAETAAEAARVARAARAAWAAWDAADTADWAAKAAESTNRRADQAYWAAKAAWKAALASGDPEKAWSHFDPCGLLQKLVEVGK
jgi:hypothetical protein